MSATETSFASVPGSHRRLTTAQAMVAGTIAAMDTDPSVLYLGSPLGAPGDSSGLLDRFGPTRVVDPAASQRPLIEPAFEAVADGNRPIVAVTVDDQLGASLDRVYGHLTRIHAETDGRDAVPLVLIVAVGDGDSPGRPHTPCLWGTFAHLPGMKVVAPSNPYDAKGLMIAAIRDDSPVVYLFHRGALGPPWPGDDVYATADVPDTAYEVPLGRAAIARSGTDVTVVAVSRSVHHTLDVTDTLAGQGIDTEVIDLRSLVPLDRNAILDSVARTGRLVVVDEDYLSYGMSGEVVATVTDVDPALLRVPVQRVARPDRPLPAASDLRQAMLPGPNRIEAAIRRALDS